MVFMSTSITVYPTEFSRGHMEVAEYSQKVGELAGVPPQCTARNETQGGRRVLVDLERITSSV